MFGAEGVSILIFMGIVSLSLIFVGGWIERQRQKKHQSIWNEGAGRDIESARFKSLNEVDINATIILSTSFLSDEDIDEEDYAMYRAS